MTREEAINVLNNFPIDFRNSGGFEAMEALKIAILALRPVSREQVEKVWRGEWEEERFSGELEGWQHRECGRHSTEKSMWCPKCGKAMTDEAVEMVMERLEALKDGKGD